MAERQDPNVGKKVGTPMNRESIKERIRQNLDERGLYDDLTEIRVQPDMYDGWQIAVIASQFQKLPMEQRKVIALKGLDEINLAWYDFLTPDQKEWAGELPWDFDPKISHFPLWPETLARGNQPLEDIEFPSDSDEDLDPPIMVTFLYVLSDLDNGVPVDMSKHILQVPGSDSLFLVPAGIPTANYARLLSFINPDAWYREERNILHEFFEMLKNGLPFVPDAILIDSRTGITPLSGPLLFDIADLAIITFFPHPQSKLGTAQLVKGLLHAKTLRNRQFTPEPLF